jgi:hypothetical protein
MSKQISGIVTIITYTKESFDLQKENALKVQPTIEGDVIWQDDQGDFGRVVMENAFDQPEVVQSSVRSARERSSARPRITNRRPWTESDLVKLKSLSKQYISANEMARILNRTPGAIRQKAKDLEISVGHTRGRRKW